MNYENQGGSIVCRVHRRHMTACHMTACHMTACHMTRSLPEEEEAGGRREDAPGEEGKAEGGEGWGPAPRPLSRTPVYQSMADLTISEAQRRK